MHYNLQLLDIDSIMFQEKLPHLYGATFLEPEPVSHMRLLKLSVDHVRFVILGSASAEIL